MRGVKRGQEPGAFMDEVINKELLDAVIANRCKIVKYLLEKGADPNYYEDGAKIRPLHFAALYNSFAVIPMLVLAGGDLDATTECNDTPLQIAERHNHREAAILLKKFYSISADHPIQQ